MTTINEIAGPESWTHPPPVGALSGWEIRDGAVSLRRTLTRAWVTVHTAAAVSDLFDRLRPNPLIMEHPKSTTQYELDFLSYEAARLGLPAVFCLS